MPNLSKQITKIISLSLFVVTTIIKMLCILILNGQMDSLCIAGWHVNEEVFNQLLLVTIGLIPDIIMLICIGAGMAFKDSNIGADPGTIVYNFLVGFLTIGALFSVFGIEDCKSENLSIIKLVGIFAIIAGVLHITNGVTCVLFLAKEEITETRTQPRPSTSRPSKILKPSTSAV